MTDAMRKAWEAYAASKVYPPIQPDDAPRDLITALVAACGWTMDEAYAKQAATGPWTKPHGRLAWTIPLDGGCALDISVMPRLAP